MEDTFVLDIDELTRHATYASIELDNTGILTAPADKFAEVFSREAINELTNEYRFSTSGHIVDERIKARR